MKKIEKQLDETIQKVESMEKLQGSFEAEIQDLQAKEKKLIGLSEFDGDQKAKTDLKKVQEEIEIKKERLAGIKKSIGPGKARIDELKAELDQAKTGDMEKELKAKEKQAIEKVTEFNKTVDELQGIFEELNTLHQQIGSLYHVFNKGKDQTARRKSPLSVLAKYPDRLDAERIDIIDPLARRNGFKIPASVFRR